MLSAEQQLQPLGPTEQGVPGFLHLTPQEGHPTRLLPGPPGLQGPPPGSRHDCGPCDLGTVSRQPQLARLQTGNTLSPPAVARVGTELWGAGRGQRAAGYPRCVAGKAVPVTVPGKLQQPRTRHHPRFCGDRYQVPTCAPVTVMARSSRSTHVHIHACAHTQTRACAHMHTHKRTCGYNWAGPATHPRAPCWPPGLGEGRQRCASGPAAHGRTAVAPGVWPSTPGRQAALHALGARM